MEQVTRLAHAARRTQRMVDDRKLRVPRWPIANVLPYLSPPARRAGVMLGFAGINDPRTKKERLRRQADSAPYPRTLSPMGVIINTGGWAMQGKNCKTAPSFRF